LSNMGRGGRERGKVFWLARGEEKNLSTTTTGDADALIANEKGEEKTKKKLAISPAQRKGRSFYTSEKTAYSRIGEREKKDAFQQAAPGVGM